MRQALTAWHRPTAAAEMAERILHWNPEAGDSRAAELKLKAHNVKELRC